MKKIILIWLFLLPSLCWGATYYVKTGGNDNATGLSDAAAWATTTRVMATSAYSALVSSGDTVYFRNTDTWTNKGVLGQDDLTVLVAKEGVTYDGKTYGTGTRATFQVTEPLWYGAISIQNSDVTVRGFEIDGNDINTNGVVIGWGADPATSSFSNVVVDDCIVHSTSDPTYLGAALGTYPVIVSGGADAPGITVGNVTLSNIEVYDAGGEGIALYTTWQKAGNKTDTVDVNNCYIHDMGYPNAYSPSGAYHVWGNGITVANNADNVTLRNNRIEDVNNIGIWVRTQPIANTVSGNGSPHGLKIYGNTIKTSGHYGILFANPLGARAEATEGGSRLGMTANVYNNVVSNTGGSNGTFPLGCPGQPASPGSNYIIYLDVPPATDWAEGDVVTGQTSAKTATVVSKLDAYRYVIGTPSGTYTKGEVVGVTGTPAKLADQGANYPVTGLAKANAADIAVAADTWNTTEIALYNNTILNNTNTCQLASGSVWLGNTYVGDGTWSVASAVFTLKNNIVYNTSALSLWYPVYDRTGTFVHSNNAIFRTESATNRHVTIFNPATNYDRNGAAADVTNWEATVVKVDPKLTSSADFHLLLGSPAINAGADVSLTSDIDGNSVPYGSKPDIGAYEYRPLHFWNF